MRAVYGLFVHGIGTQQPGFSANAREWLDAGLRDGHLGETGALYAQEACWAPVLDGLEQRMMCQVGRGGSSNSAPQRLALDTLADALCFQHRRDDIFDVLDRAYVRLRAPERVHIFAHSLGCLLAVEWLRARPRVKVAQLVTFGCNLQLFHLGDRAFCAPEQVRKSGDWINFFDERDLLGWPLRAWLPHVQDVEVVVGRWLRRKLGLSHIAYFDNRKFWRETVPAHLV